MRLYEIAKTAASCDSLQRYQGSEIAAAARLQTAADSLLSLTTYQLVLARADRGMANQEIENHKALTRDQARKTRRWFFAFCGIVAAWVGTEILTD